MITTYLIFVALTATVLAKGSIECNFGDSSGTRQCHGAEGQKLSFHLSNETNTELMLIKDAKYRIFKKTKNGTVTLDETYVSQFDQIQKGILSLGQATKKHAGQYLLEEYGFDDGKIMKHVEVNLTIHAPITKPTVTQVCFSSQLMSVTCSSKEDGTEFLLTVDDNILIQNKHSSQSLNSTGENSRVSSVSINIHGQLTGMLVCQIWNNYSRNETVFHLMACKGSDTVMRVAFIVKFLLLVAFGPLLIKRCKKNKSTPASNGACEDENINSNLKKAENPHRSEPNMQENAE